MTQAAGIGGYGIGLAATWWDYNDDGWMDLYVSNDYKGADQLYRNQGDGTFAEVARASLPHLPWYSMGSATADINNDGRIDLLASDMSGTNHFKQKLGMGDMQQDLWFLRVADPPQYMRNALYVNTGTERLLELAYLTGLANSDWTWSPVFGDLDNDGWTDLFISNGMSRDFIDSDLVGQIKNKQSAQWLNQPIRRDQNLAFRNQGDLRFADVSSAWGLDHRGASYGAALADLDRDGDLDLVVTNFEEPVAVYENVANDHHALALRLIGTASNRWGIGARVELETSDGLQSRCLSSGQGFMSAGEPLLHFGLGSNDQVRRLTVVWPSGIRQDVENLVADRLVTIREPLTEVVPPGPATDTWFVRSNRALGVPHRETEFDDFRQQPLLPGKLSQQGPGLAVGDVDGDDADELYLSGAAGQSGQLIELRHPGPAQGLARDPASQSDELGALLFDLDGDGDQDLYVVSGSVEAQEGSPSLRDRLYLNDGHGAFSEARLDAWPDLCESGSCVAAADYDRDGDLDLFVGGRVTPGRYPTSPPTRLLRNDLGHLSLAADALPDATNIARATSAIWSDVDADDWVDLLVTQEWGPVRFLRNDQGVLHDATDAAGLAAHVGWWNGIAGRDLDGDGDIDYVVTNQGLNTKYRASRDQPVVLYYGEFAGSDQMQIVEATYEDDVLYPTRGRSCSAAAMPLLSQRFTSFRQFAAATLQDVYPAEELAKALRLEANTLETGVLLNDGSGRFRFRPLPRLAQVAPAYGVALADFDGDGRVDIYLVHNNFSPQPETGRMDGGLSLLLRGKGDGTFDPVEPRESGLIVPGDAKSLVVTDLHDDARPDLLVGVNNGPVIAFENRAGRTEDFVTVRLRAAGANRTAVGARLQLTLADGTRQTAEVYAGAGHLSQSTASVTFGLAGQRADALDVRWPDGRSSRHQVPTGQPCIAIQQPIGL